MRLSRLILLAVATVSLFALAAPASAVPSLSVVINEVQTRGDNGGNDEFIELRNISTQPVDISGFRVLGCNVTGSITSRATIPPNTPPLPSGAHYLLTNNNGAGSLPPLPSYNGPVPGDQTYGLGITDTGGVRLQTPGNVVVDQVGFTANPCTETAPAANDEANIDNSASRSEVVGVTLDSDVNSVDFTPSMPPTPTNSSGA